MARITSLNILLDPTGKAYLAELYGRVIENVEKKTISSILKNRDLSGDPQSGTVEATRYQNAAVKEYKTARTATKGDSVSVKQVTIPLDQNKEIVEELEDKDIRLYGVDGVLERRALNHIASMVKSLERAFFLTAATAASVEFAPSSGTNTIGENLEELIVALEKTQNSYVDGVERGLMALVLNTDTYSLARNYLDITVNNANVNTAAEAFGLFHGVRVYSSVYLPVGTKAILLVEGAVAQPVTPKGGKTYIAEKIPLSNAFGVELFFNYGTKSVADDLIHAWKTQLEKPAAGISSSTYTITAVTNATHYDIYSGTALIKADLAPATAGGNATFDLSTVLTADGTYSITCIAKNVASGYQNSAASDADSYIVGGN